MSIPELLRTSWESLKAEQQKLSKEKEEFEKQKEILHKENLDWRKPKLTDTPQLTQVAYNDSHSSRDPVSAKNILV